MVEKLLYAWTVVKFYTHWIMYSLVIDLFSFMLVKSMLRIYDLFRFMLVKSMIYL
jgi:hypothetical protein